MGREKVDKEEMVCGAPFTLSVMFSPGVLSHGPPFHMYTGHIHHGHNETNTPIT